MGKITSYAEKTTTVGADLVVIVDSATTSEKKVQLTNIIPAGTVTYAKLDSTFLSGWVTETATWTYASGTGTNVGTFTVSGDYTTIYQAGDRLKFTQTTVKYAIVTKVSYSAPNTTVTIYMGTDYTIANAAITSPFYSHVKNPIGFSTDPIKWTITTTNTNQCSKASPTANTWYGDTGLTSTGPNISLPIGAWKVGYYAQIEALKSAATSVNVKVTLSTASNSESDATFTLRCDLIAASGSLDPTWGVFKEMYITTTSTTTYYLNVATTVASVGTIALDGNLTTTIIRAVCAYL